MPGVCVKDSESQLDFDPVKDENKAHNCAVLPCERVAEWNRRQCTCKCNDRGGQGREGWLCGIRGNRHYIRSGNHEM